MDLRYDCRSVWGNRSISTPDRDNDEFDGDNSVGDTVVGPAWFLPDRGASSTLIPMTLIALSPFSSRGWKRLTLQIPKCWNSVPMTEVGMVGG